ncbi:MAG: tetratricopeptide repeat protein [Pirellulaceae bacterium]|nr:tetratricopeptide repeat protein [Pirellulaceae bacterium]
MKRISISIIACTFCLTLTAGAQEAAPKPHNERGVVEQLPGNAERRAAATHPNAVLSPFIDDSFASDSRKDYQIKGDVQWSPGKLALQQAASITRSLKCGPRVKMFFKFIPPEGPRADEPQELQVVFTPAPVTSFGWDNIAAGVPASVTVRQQRLGNKQIELSVTIEAALSWEPNVDPWDPRVKLSRKMIVERASHIAELEIEYRFGVITVFLAGKPVLYGQTHNAYASLKTITVGQSLGQVEISQISVSVSPEPKLPPFVQRLRLLEAAAADFGGMSRTNAGQIEEGEKQIRTGYELCKEILGEDHEYTQTALAHLAFNLVSQGKYAEAQPLLYAAIDLHLGLFGEMNEVTLQNNNNLAVNLQFQGKSTHAQPLLQKNLDLIRELHGELHPRVASSYNNLANNLQQQGKYAEAQPLFQKALDLSRELFGERHPATALDYNNLAANLALQGKHTEALPLIQKAHDLCRELLGEQHPDTATSYQNVATNLLELGKYAEALPLFQKAHDLVGERHPNRVLCISGLASTLAAQKKYADAQPLYQQALDLSRELLGEQHPSTALSYSNLAANLYAQGKYAEAHPVFQKALDLWRELFGELHPYTANTYCNLAADLLVLRKSHEALATLERGIHSYEASRLVGAGGLDRATLKLVNPRFLVAAIRANSDPEAAWSAAEMTLARGLLDQQAAQKTSSLAPAELADQAGWASELASLQAQVLRFVTKSNRTDSETKQLEALLGQRRQVEEHLAALAVRVSQREVSSPAAIRAALSSDAALLFWVDITDEDGHIQEHWGCIVRSTGEAKWERLPGTGPENQWTQTDTELFAKLRAALAGNAAASEIAALSHQIRAQRLAPLAQHLAGVKTLYVVPVNEMAGIPVEALTTDYTISYVPSGTFLARLKDRAKPTGTALLALADPVFILPGETPKGRTVLPLGGVLITQVVPGGAADQARLKGGDVLLKYGDTELTDVDKLKEAIAAKSAAKTIPVTVWREDADKPFVRDLAPGKLGVVLDKNPAPVAIASRRKSDALVLVLRGGDWTDLPGTRIESSRIGQLFGANATVLADSAASEQKLEAIRRAGDLKKFRYLHFATHGEGNSVRAFESALILAQDTLPKDPRPRAGEPFINGQLSAGEVLEFWKLDAELVTLSACETAVGREGGGDGPLGFAQAFLTAGSRAVCLSLWKVDDSATTLLMDRFYQNLLGKRPGLYKPMGKAAALAEAKNWLRNLSSDEALKLTADMTKGVVRGKRQKALPVVAIPKPDDPAAAKDFKPFDHPKYWAAFILIGDPD